MPAVRAVCKETVNESIVASHDQLITNACFSIGVIFQWHLLYFLYVTWFARYELYIQHETGAISLCMWVRYTMISLYRCQGNLTKTHRLPGMVFKITFIISLVVNHHLFNDLLLWRIYASPKPNYKPVHWCIYASLCLYVLMVGRLIIVLAWRCIDVSKPNFFIIYWLFMYADSEGCNALHCYQ